MIPFNTISDKTIEELEKYINVHFNLTKKYRSYNDLVLNEKTVHIHFTTKNIHTQQSALPHLEITKHLGITVNSKPT